MSLLSKSSRSALGACALILSLAPLAPEAAAQVPREPHGPLDALVYVDPHLRPAPSGAVSFESAAGELPAEVRDGWSDFLALSEGPWKGYVDRRTGRTVSVTALETREMDAGPFVSVSIRRTLGAR